LTGIVFFTHQCQVENVACLSVDGEKPEVFVPRDVYSVKAVPFELKLSILVSKKAVLPDLSHVLKYFTVLIVHELL